MDRATAGRRRCEARASGARSPWGSRLLAAALALIAAETLRAATGPLTVHPQNPRYFADGLGQAVYLTGSHTWSNLQEEQSPLFAPVFDFNAYLDFLEQNHHNFIRLWRLEMPRVRYSGDTQYRTTWPHPWARTGPGSAGDGLLKFNLNVFDQSYFTRLRQRCVAAGNRGIYVSIMLFEGHALSYAQEGWFSHPFKLSNNINSINGDPNNDGRGTETHTLAPSPVVAVQEAYVRKVIDTVNDLDNVMYEIANESHGGSIPWQGHFVNYIKTYEASKPKQHPVWFSTPLAAVEEELWDSNAEAISPGATIGGGAYQNNPPAADGTKVIISDSDHLFGCGGNVEWVWKSFTRGLNPIYMDSYYSNTPFCPGPNQSIRSNLGYARLYAERMNLARAMPANALSSTGYCLADAGVAYLAYASGGGTISLDLRGASGQLSVEWFNPATGVATMGAPVSGGAWRALTSPFSGQAVVFVEGASAATPGDLNGDGQVNVTDLLALLVAWGACGAQCPADLNGDGTVNVSDLFLLIGEWG